MFVMTAKVDIKKILIILAAAAGLIIALLVLFGGNNGSVTTATTPVSGNDARIAFLKDLGWEVSASPAESSQVRIPQEQTQLYERYNALQKSCGYDLSQYAGKAVMRYVYKVNNFPGATEPVYATVLVYKNQIIGGDITDTSAKGHIRPFKMPDTGITTPTQTTTAPGMTQ